MSAEPSARLSARRAGRLFAGALALAMMAAPVPAWAQRVHGVMMPPGATQIGEDRFRAPKDYRRTIRYFSRLYGRSRSIVWRPIRGSANVTGVHIINNRDNRSWDAINVYEADRKVFIYVMKPEPQKNS